MKNFILRYKKIIFPITAALMLGGIGGGTSYGVISYQDRNRSAVVIPAEVVRTDHVGVQAALAVNNAAMRGNGLLNKYRSNELSSKELIAQNSSLISAVDSAGKKSDAALSYYMFIRDSMVLANSGGDIISSAWHHSRHEETTTTVSVSVDSEGNASTTTTTTCDYIDHTWKFTPKRASEGIETYLKGMNQLKKSTKNPKLVDVSFLESLMKNSLLKEGESELSVEESSERTKQMTDWLRSVTIRGNNAVVADISYLIGAVQGGELSWIKDNYAKNGKGDPFPLLAAYRDKSCGDGIAPKGYNTSLRFDSRTDAAMSHYANLVNRVNGSIGLLKEYKTKLLEINQDLAKGKSTGAVENKYDELGEIAIKLHKTFNPNSGYTSMSKGWRTAIPLMLLFGLGSLGGVGGFFLLRRHEQKKYHERMRKHRVYGW